VGSFQPPGFLLYFWSNAYGMCILDRHCQVVVMWLYTHRPTFGARISMRLFSSITVNALS